MLKSMLKTSLAGALGMPAILLLGYVTGGFMGGAIMAGGTALALYANTISRVDSTPAHEWYMGGSIRSVTPTLGVTVGTAVTCRFDSSSPGGKADFDPFWRQVDRIAQMRPPIVWVVKAVGSRPDRHS